MKSYVVTGAGSGLGRELALLLAKKKFHIYLVGRTAEKLEKVKQEIETDGGTATVLILDIRNLQEIKDKLNNITDIVGLINNAGVGYFGPFTSMSEQETETMLQTNLFGTINMTKAILPILVSQNEGHILNVISTAGLRGKKNEALYATSKFAVRGFTESLQKEYEHTNLLITAAYMGGMNTPFWESSDHVSNPSRFRSAKEVAEILVENLDKETIIIESNGTPPILKGKGDS